MINLRHNNGLVADGGRTGSTWVANGGDSPKERKLIEFSNVGEEAVNEVEESNATIECAEC